MLRSSLNHRHFDPVHGHRQIDLKTQLPLSYFSSESRPYHSEYKANTLDATLNDVSPMKRYATRLEFEAGIEPVRFESRANSSASKGSKRRFCQMGWANLPLPPSYDRPNNTALIVFELSKKPSSILAFHSRNHATLPRSPACRLVGDRLAGSPRPYTQEQAASQERDGPSVRAFSKNHEFAQVLRAPLAGLDHPTLIRGRRTVFECVRADACRTPLAATTVPPCISAILLQLDTPNTPGPMLPDDIPCECIRSLEIAHCEVSVASTSEPHCLVVAPTSFSCEPKGSVKPHECVPMSAHRRETMTHVSKCDIHIRCIIGSIEQPKSTRKRCSRFSEFAMVPMALPPLDLRAPFSYSAVPSRQLSRVLCC